MKSLIFTSVAVFTLTSTLPKTCTGYEGLVYTPDARTGLTYSDDFSRTCTERKRSIEDALLYFRSLDYNETRSIEAKMKTEIAEINKALSTDLSKLKKITAKTSMDESTEIYSTHDKVFAKALKLAKKSLQCNEPDPKTGSGCSFQSDGSSKVNVQFRIEGNPTHLTADYSWNFHSHRNESKLLLVKHSHDGTTGKDSAFISVDETKSIGYVDSYYVNNDPLFELVPGLWPADVSIYEQSKLLEGLNLLDCDPAVFVINGTLERLSNAELSRSKIESFNFDVPTKDSTTLRPATIGSNENRSAEVLNIECNQEKHNCDLTATGTDSR